MLAFFNKITRVLDELNIEYMLSGSIAMSLYVIPRATRDFDLIVNIQETDIDAFVSHFRDGYYCDKEAVLDAVKRKSIFNIIDHASGFKADFVILKNLPFRLEEFSRKVQMEFYGRMIWVVSPEDLILSKIIWSQDTQSALQLEDIKNLLEVDALDMAYIRKWVTELQLNSFNLLTE